MKGLGALAILAFLATACAASPVTSTPSPSAKGGALATPSVSPSPAGAKGGSPSPIPGVVDPSVRCPGKPTGGPIALIGQSIYDVTEPLRPRLLCHAANTVVHLN